MNNTDLILKIHSYIPETKVELIDKHTNAKHKQLLKMNINKIMKWYRKNRFHNFKNIDVNNIPNNQFIRLILRNLKQPIDCKIFISLPEFLSLSKHNREMFFYIRNMNPLHERKNSEVVTFLIKYKKKISHRHIARCMMELKKAHYTQNIM